MGGVTTPAADAGHWHLDDVRLPDGTVIWAASFPLDGYERHREAPRHSRLILDWDPDPDRTVTSRRSVSATMARR
jgi:hypothetical protein